MPLRVLRSVIWTGLNRENTAHLSFLRLTSTHGPWVQVTWPGENTKAWLKELLKIAGALPHSITGLHTDSGQRGGGRSTQL